MILDVDSPPKSPASSQPTVRQPPVTTPRHATDISHALFLGGTSSDTRSGNIFSEATPLLYDRAPQSMYDDLQPPAYEDINGFTRKTTARRRLWIRCTAVFLVMILGTTAWSGYHFRSNRNVPSQPPHDEVPAPSNPPSLPPTPSPAPLPAPLPQLPHLPDPSAPYVPPTSGRTDLCHPWAYVPLDSRPIDRLVYTVPSLLPIHIESAAICPTSSGQLEFCSNSDEPISGKLQVVGADVALPQIEVSLRRGANDGLENVSVCLVQKNEKWVLGLYVWGDEFTPLTQRITPSASILVKLPYAQVHTLSTNLDYFTQVVGSDVLTETNALVFDTLELHAEGRGGVEVRNVTVATMDAKIKDDNMLVQDICVTRLLRFESEIGIFIGWVTLVDQNNSLPVQVDLKSLYGTISIDATLEYSAQSKTTPQFDINLYSMYSPAITYIRDPRGTDSLATQKPPSVLPMILANVTSQYAAAQASVPATYHGSIELSSEYAAVATNDRARGLSGRRVSWKERVGMVYQGAVEWTTNGVAQQTGRVAVSTQFAIARLMFLGLTDGKTDLWQQEGAEITYTTPGKR